MVNPLVRIKNAVIDPAIFFVPEDVVDLRTETRDPNSEEPADQGGDASLVASTGDTTLSLMEDAPSEGSSLSTPQSLTVVQHTTRVAPDGRSVVDVVCEVESVPGALTYEVRITK